MYLERERERARERGEVSEECEESEVKATVCLERESEKERWEVSKEREDCEVRVERVKGVDGVK